jgi:dolichol-phosphate mannosyltransferase
MDPASPARRRSLIQPGFMAEPPPAADSTGATLSVIIPFFNEATNVMPVLMELREALPASEIIAVDDGSHDDTWSQILKSDGVRGLRLKSHSGQSAAIYHGLHLATRPLAGLMDGDGQSDPANFLPLLGAYERGVADVICGFRVNRQDHWNRRVAARLANRLRRLVLDDGVRDTGCAQKIFPREAIQCLVPFHGLHRYLPALFTSAGFRLMEVPLRHRPRRSGRSKYTNWRRAKQGLYDLVGVRWLLHRRLPTPPLEIKP